MNNWHHKNIEQIETKTGDIRAGEYFCYDVDTFNYLVNDKNWVRQNNAFDEYEWIIHNLDKRLESNDGTLVFIPAFETAIRIDNYYDYYDYENYLKYT